MSESGPSINVRMSGDLNDGFDNIAAKIKAQRQAVNELERGMRDLARAGKEIAPEISKRVQDARENLASLEEIRTGMKHQREHLMHDYHQAHNTEKLMSRIRGFANSPMMRKMMTGEMITGSDVAREIVASEKLTKSIGKALGASTQAIRMLHPALMVGVEAYELTSEIIHKRHEQEKFHDELQREIGRGHVGKDLMDAFEEEQEKHYIKSFFGFNPGGEKVKKIQELADGMHGLTAEEITGSLNAFNRGTQTEFEGPDSLKQARREKDWQRMSLEDKRAIFKTDEMIGELIPELIEGEEGILRNKMGRELKPFEQKRIEQKVIKELIDKKIIDEDAVKAIKEGKKAREEFKETQEQSKTVSEEFNEKEEKNMAAALLAVHRKRIPACPTD